MWHHFLKIKQIIHIELYKKLPGFEAIKERARIIEEEAELIEGTKNLLKEWEEKKQEIYIEVEDFLKRNNLRLTLPLIPFET